MDLVPIFSVCLTSPGVKDETYPPSFLPQQPVLERISKPCGNKANDLLRVGSGEGGWPWRAPTPTSAKQPRLRTWEGSGAADSPRSLAVLLDLLPTFGEFSQVPTPNPSPGIQACVTPGLWPTALASPVSEVGDALGEGSRVEGGGKDPGHRPPGTELGTAETAIPTSNARGRQDVSGRGRGGARWFWSA